MKPPIHSNIAIPIIFFIAVASLGLACSDEVPEAISETSDIEEGARAGVVFLTEPSTTVAGDGFSATVQLVDKTDAPLRVEATPITIVLNKNQFADGETKAQAMTDAEGVAHFALTIEHAAKGYQLVAVGMHEGHRTSSSRTSTFDIDAAAPAAATSTIWSANGVADEERSIVITVGILDVYGNPIEGTIPEFSASGEENVYHACSATDSAGISTCTMASTRAGARSLQLTAPVDVAGNTVKIRAAEPLAEASTISGTDGVIDDAEGAQITIKLVDRFGNAVTGVTPSFQATGEGNHYAPCSLSDDEGVSNCIMTSSRAELKTLRVSDPLDLEGDVIEFFAWDCDADASPFGGGSGDAEDDPYRLCTPQHLNAIGDEPSYMDKYFVVARDIDMEGIPFHMIASSDSRFTGHFDGQRRPIANLVIESEEPQHTAFFRFIEPGGHVQDVILEDINITGDEWVAGLVSENKGTILRSDVSGSVQGLGRVVGGLVAYNREEGAVRDAQADVTLEGRSWVGGLVGYNNGAVETSYAHSHILGEDRHLGGLVGLNNQAGSINTSYSTGTVEGIGTYLGGLVGTNSGEVQTSYSTSEVTGGTVVGGLVGNNSGRVGALARVLNAYAIGILDGDASVGGLVGQSQNGEIIASFWNVETSGWGISAGGEGLNTEEFANTEYFREMAGWDFIETWVMMNFPEDATYPVLQWQVD